MYEHHSEPLLPKNKFIRRFMFHALIAGEIIAGSLIVGICGYHFIEGFPWVDSVLNASMILGGMGEVDPLTSTAGKLFASFYSLFAGIVFLGTAGILVAPVAHRLLHHLHLDEGKEGKRKR